MHLKILAFARVAEVLGWTRRDLEIEGEPAVADVWDELQRAQPALAALADSTRVARNGRVVNARERLSDGDEIALLPPAGGG